MKDGSDTECYFMHLETDVFWMMTPSGSKWVEDIRGSIDKSVSEKHLQ